MSSGKAHMKLKTALIMPTVKLERTVKAHRMRSSAKFWSLRPARMSQKVS